MNLLQNQVAQELLNHIDLIMEMLDNQVSHDPDFEPTRECTEQLKYEIETLLCE